MRHNPCRRLPALVADCLAISLAACSTSDQEGEHVERPVAELCNTAVDAALEGNFRSAAPLFDEVERQHPYSVRATQARLTAAYSLYRSNQYGEVINALDRFMHMNVTRYRAPPQMASHFTVK